MSTINKEALIEENNDIQTKRKFDKHQTFLPKKMNIFHQLEIDKKKPSIIQNIKESQKVKKKTLFSDKTIDKLFFKSIKDSIINTPVFEYMGIKEKSKKNYDIISQEYKKYEQKFGYNLSYNDRKKLKDEKTEDIQKILDILLLSPSKRTFHHVYTMKKYFLTTKIDWLFKDEFENKEESIEKLLTFFGLEMKYQFFKEGEEIFKVGDTSVYLYLILQGKIEILKPTPEITYMSGNEYFAYIMYLKIRKEEQLLNINLEENYKVFDINKNEIDLLPSVYIYFIVELMKIGKKLNFEEELSVVNMTLSDLKLTQETMNSREILSQCVEKNVPFVPPLLMNKYKFIVDKDNKKKLKLIKYTRVLTLECDEFFGESAMGENEKRNATIRVLENSYIGYLSARLYKTNFFLEKKLSMQKKIIFLNERFFFKNINLKKFSKKYFNLFVYEKYLNGTILFKENEELNYVYFIEEGLVELTSTKTMLQVDIFLRGLQEKFSLKEEENSLKYNALKSRTKDLEDYLNKTQNIKILIVGKNESLGIESFFYGIPYYATAKVASERAKIFKISIEQLYQILSIETDCFSSLKNLVLKKTKILLKRLFSMNNTKLVLLDNKIVFNYKFDFNKNYIHKIKEETKKDKNKLICKDIKLIKNKNISLTPRNNGFTRDKKRNIYFRQKDATSNSIYLLIQSNRYDFMQKEKIKNMKKRMKVLNKIPSFEDRWLNHAKNDIKLINTDIKFVTLFKNDNHKLNLKIDNYEKKLRDEEIQTKEKNNKNKISNNNSENIKKLGNSNKEIIDNKNKTPRLKGNNSSDAILPSISKNKQFENSFKYSSFYNSLNNSKENNLINTNWNSFKSSTMFNNNFKSYCYKNNFKKTYIKLSHKKINNCYETKNKFNQKKFKFYNDSEIFMNRRERRNKYKNQIIIQNSM